VSRMLFGIQSSQDVKLSNIGRALGEDIPLIRTAKCLSRNLKQAELERQLTPRLILTPQLIRWRPRTSPARTPKCWPPSI
jgi:hypothetical protein